MTEDLNITLNNHKISIEKTITIIQGDYTSDDLISTGLNCADWNELVITLINEFQKSLPYILKRKAFEDPIDNTDFDYFNSRWHSLLLIKDQFQQFLHAFHDLSQSQILLSEQNHLNQEVSQLKQDFEQIDIISSNSLLASKQDLLNKLQLEYQNLTKKSQDQQNLFQSNESNMKQYQEQKTQITDQIDLIKEAQRALFKETNKITSQMDEIEGQKEVYEEKLPALKAANENEDYNRIQNKLTPLQEEYAKLKSERNQKMQKSKDLQNQLSSNQKQLKEITTKIQQIQPEYDKLHGDFSGLKEQLEVTEKKIIQTKKEIEKESSQYPKKSVKKSSKSTGFSQTIPTQSKSQLEKMIHEKEAQLQSITAKLSEQPKKSLNEDITTNPLFGQLEEQQNELVQGISDLETNPSIVTEVEMLLRFLRKFCENINLYLAPLNISVENSLSFDFKSDNSIQISLKIFQKGKEISFEEGLKRTDKAYFALAFITALYIAQENPIIPLRFDLLPSFMTTKQTFLGVVSTFQSSLDQLKLSPCPSIIFFVFDSKQSFDSAIII